MPRIVITGNNVPVQGRPSAGLTATCPHCHSVLETTDNEANATPHSVPMDYSLDFTHGWLIPCPGCGTQVFFERK